MKHTFFVRFQDVVVLTYSQVGTEGILFIISTYPTIYRMLSIITAYILLCKFTFIGRANPVILNINSSANIIIYIIRVNKLYL